MGAVVDVVPDVEVIPKDEGAEFVECRISLGNGSISCLLGAVKPNVVDVFSCFIDTVPVDVTDGGREGGDGPICELEIGG